MTATVKGLADLDLSETERRAIEAGNALNLLPALARSKNGPARQDRRGGFG
jgi:hypothetical protein